ncbi:MAG: beta-ketoacyl synthase N-terminal-like domain-containing protein [Polyangiales bacterium]
MAVADRPLDPPPPLRPRLGDPRHDHGRGRRDHRARRRVDAPRPRRDEPPRAPKYAPYLLSMAVARRLRTRGQVLTLPAACAAGNYAIGYASDLLRADRADVVVTGASEMLQEVGTASAPRRPRAERCQPFDLNRPQAHPRRRERRSCSRPKTTPRPAARQHRRGRRLRPRLRRAPHHPPRARGGASSAMREAIARSGLSPDEVDFVNAHGTGTRANDSVEHGRARGLRRAKRVPVSSVKSMLGHTMGASARRRPSPASRRSRAESARRPSRTRPRPRVRCVDLVANAARSGPADVVINNALAFYRPATTPCCSSLKLAPARPR